MNRIEKIYRMRRNVLIVAFVWSILLFIWYCLPGLLSRGKPWHFFDRLPISFFAISGIIAALLLLILITRYLLFKASTLKDPALRPAVDDERVRQNWLKAYRTAFYTMVGIPMWVGFLQPPG
jgi:MFS family permease